MGSVYRQRCTYRWQEKCSELGTVWKSVTLYKMKTFLIKDILELDKVEKKKDAVSSSLEREAKIDRDESTGLNENSNHKKGKDNKNTENRSIGWRKKFSLMQRKLLEESFQAQKYLSVKQRHKLAKEIDLSSEQVKTWYQNRRTRWRRNVMARMHDYIWKNMQLWSNTEIISIYEKKGPRMR